MIVSDRQVVIEIISKAKGIEKSAVNEQVLLGSEFEIIVEICMATIPSANLLAFRDAGTATVGDLLRQLNL